MGNKQTSGDVAVFTIGGSSQLAVLNAVTYDLEFDTEDGSVVSQDARVLQKGKRGGTIKYTQYSTISDGLRVSALECSVFTIGGADYLPTLQNLRFSGENETGDSSGAADKWKYNQWKGKRDYSVEIDLWLPATAGVALAAEMHNAARATTHLTVSFTLNGVAITLPMNVYKAVHKITDGEFAMYTISAKGMRPDNLATAFPTSPTGTTTLLEKAFNAPGTALALVLTSHATEGVAYSGNAVISAFGFEITDGKVVKTDYTFLTQDTWTATAN